MPDDVLQISREAKVSQGKLKESLKTHDPWDKDIDFQRRNLRHRYLQLLLVHPYAKESKDVENHLWMQTSYALIALYKQRISAVERAPPPPPRQPGQHSGGHQSHGPVEHRKLVQRFRQFLAEEEKFWTQLVVRFRRSFALDEAEPALRALTIVPATEDVNSPTSEDHFSRNGASSRNQFPVEGDPVPPTEAQRAGRLAILSKALVCLGDISRYREQYNETGGKLKAGHDEMFVKKNGRGGSRRVEAGPRMRNYDRAQQYYEQARLLVPDEGNPSHQLAILAAYQKDVFGSLLHYYRALCVRQPYDTAAENLNTVLTKALEQYKVKLSRKEEPAPVAPRLKVEVLKEKVVVLHALWRLDVDEMDHIAPHHADKVIAEYSTLVADRVLPSDIIYRVLIFAIGALWKHRMIRDPNSSSSKRDSTGTSARRAAAIESRMATHVLDLYRALLTIGIQELSETTPDLASAPPAGLNDDLAQQITATFRRTLPALRIASKWLRSNFAYVTAAAQSVSTPIDYTESIASFWTEYVSFYSALCSQFPLGRLPNMNGPLDEDVEMSGFSPLKRFMMEPSTRTSSGLAPGQSEVHPNEEQLMRIADLLADAVAITELERSPIFLSRDRFALKGTEDSQMDASHRLPAPVQALSGTSLAMIMNRTDLPRPPDADDDAMTETSRTDDDPVGDAFRQALDGSDAGEEIEEEEQEDEIVWNPRATLSPRAPSSIPPLPLPSPPAPYSPIRSSFSPKRLSAPPKGDSPVTTPTTAQDLLNNVMGLPRTSSDLGRQLQSTVQQPSLLFGSGSSKAPTHSIWSTALDSNPLSNGILTGGQVKQPSHQQFVPQLPESTQSLWSSLYSHSASNSQQFSQPVMPFGPQPILNVGSHQHTSSLPHVMPSQPFGYPGAPPSHVSSYVGHGSYYSPVHRQDASVREPIVGYPPSWGTT